MAKQQLINDRFHQTEFKSAITRLGRMLIYRENGDIVVGHDAVRQADHNPLNTFYDAKRFIGKIFTAEEFQNESARYPFKVSAKSRVKDSLGYFKCFFKLKKKYINSSCSFDSLLE